MFKRKKRAAKVAKKVSVSLPTGALHGTATRAGWSYYRTWAQCPRLWFLKYVAKLVSADAEAVGGRSDGRMIGTLYHGLVLGTHATDPEWKKLAANRPDLLLYARELAAVRLQKGEPLSSTGVVTEKALDVPGLNMTSQPDRVETVTLNGRKVKTARDLKALKSFGGQDVLAAEVDGQFIAEMLATGAKHCVVDIIKKTKVPVPMTVAVTLTEHKETFLRAQVNASEREMKEALTRWRGEFADDDAAALTEHPKTLAAFPPRLNACVQRGVCDFYEFCHGGEAVKSSYVVRDAPLEDSADE